MKFLGIDPGIEITGFGIVDIDRAHHRLLEYGVLRTPRTLTLPERLEMLHTDLSELLSRHQDIVCVGVEELFFAKNAKTAFVVGQARGVILFTLQQSGCTIEEVKPVEVKSAIVGSGHADKKAVQRMIQLRFQLTAPPQPDDAADAIAIALTAAARYHMKK
ncbi:MAG: crossover junction endodeoxyribonuclease RuvC [Candidatus Kerfeldbacteria bacterium]|nr:crossover junction endodeoxyribonuclease RuvC [Candidatus Kerfeldbacteria bacterium]